jgi:hypothetical protein
MLLRRQTTSTGGNQPPNTAPSGFDRKSIKDQILLDCPEVYFRFDEPSGNAAIDHSGFGRNGVYGASAQFNRPAIAGGLRSVYNPQLTYSFPVVTRLDAYNNPSQKQDFSAVCLVRLLSSTNNGIIFNAGASFNGICLGKGYDSNPGSNGNVIVGLANNEAYIDGQTQFKSGVNLLGVTARARDNAVVIYLNGLPVKAMTQSFQALTGVGAVGFIQSEAFPHALCEYGEYAFFQSELPAVRMAAYWKAVQLSSL